MTITFMTYNTKHLRPAREKESLCVCIQSFFFFSFSLIFRDANICVRWLFVLSFCSFYISLILVEAKFDLHTQYSIYCENCRLIGFSFQSHSTFGSSLLVLSVLDLLFCHLRSCLFLFLSFIFSIVCVYTLSVGHMRLL